MYIYLISQTVNKHHDTFDSAIVVAHDEQEAQYLHPEPQNNLGQWWEKQAELATWAHPKDVTVKYIGEASSEFVTSKLILASFNAG